jgi:hypothetical protein
VSQYFHERKRERTHNLLRILLAFLERLELIRDLIREVVRKDDMRLRSLLKRGQQLAVRRVQGAG